MTFTPDQCLELAEALGEVRASDGAPYLLSADDVVRLVREMRDELDAWRVEQKP